MVQTHIFSVKGERGEKEMTKKKKIWSKRREVGGRGGK